MLQSNDIGRKRKKKTIPINMLPTGDTLQIKGHIDTESNKMEKAY